MASSRRQSGPSEQNGRDKVDGYDRQAEMVFITFCDWVCGRPIKPWGLLGRAVPSPTDSLFNKPVNKSKQVLDFWMAC